MKNDDVFANWFIERFTISIIENCLENGEFAQNDSLEKIKNIVYSDEYFKPDNLGFVFTHVDSLKESIAILLNNKHYNEAIVLAMTCIEHELNSFYAHYFDHILNMSNAKKEGIIKSNNISEKIGGLFLAVFNENFPDKLSANIMNLNQKRNAFIHYKSPVISLDNVDNNCIKDDEIENTALASLTTINELEIFITEKEMALFPNKSIAQEIFNRIKEEENNEKKEMGDKTNG